MPRILVTRAAHQADGLLDGLTALGHQAIHCPCVEIEPLTSQAPILPAAITLFVSTNAVRHCQLPTDKLDLGQLIAIGPATGKLLYQQGWGLASLPETYSSEGLLALPELQQIVDTSINIVSGQDPRPLLAETLSQRGAQLNQLFTYQRICPSEAPALAALNPGDIDVIVITSEAILRNLSQLIEQTEQTWLYGTQLVVVRDTLVPTAKALGFGADISVTANATDEAIIDHLKVMA